MPLADTVGRTGHVAHLHRRRVRPEPIRERRLLALEFLRVPDRALRRASPSATSSRRAKSLNDPSLTGSDLLIAALAGQGRDARRTCSATSRPRTSPATTRRAGLKATLPAVYKLVPTGSATGALGTQSIAVNHLAARYLAFQRGTGASDGPCYAATLSISVSFPSTLGARPVYRWTAAGSTAQPLAVSGLDRVDLGALGHLLVEGRRAALAPEPDRDRRRRGVQGLRLARRRQEHVRDVDAAARGHVHRPDDPGARG